MVSSVGERLSLAERFAALKPGVGSHRVSLPKESAELSDKLQKIQTLVLCLESISLLESSEFVTELELNCELKVAEDMVSSTRLDSDTIRGIEDVDTGLIDSPGFILNRLRLEVGLGVLTSLPGELSPTPNTFNVLRPLIRGLPGNRFFL